MAGGLGDALPRLVPKDSSLGLFCCAGVCLARAMVSEVDVEVAI